MLDESFLPAPPLPPCESNVTGHFFITNASHVIAKKGLHPEASSTHDNETWTRFPIHVKLSNLKQGQVTPDWWCSPLTNLNPSPLFLPNGTVLLAVTSHCGSKGERVLIARGESVFGPYVVDASVDPVFGNHFLTSHAEDPYLYRTRRGFHILAHCMDVYCIQGGKHAFSEDGVHWKSHSTPVYSPWIRLKSGQIEYLFRRERPKLVLDDQGLPLYLVNGILSWEGAFLDGGRSHTLVQQIRR